MSRVFHSYFKFIFFSFLLFLNHETLAQPVCAEPDKTIDPSHIKEIKKNFDIEIEAHYNRLVKKGSFPKFERKKFIQIYYKNYYENKAIEVYSNPRNSSQKIVYIEYDKNWWGSLYFVVFKDKKNLKWTPIPFYGAIIKCVQWDENSFFHESSTHQGSKAKGSCSIRKDSIQCEKSVWLRR